jgi:hypothetical protein
MDKKKLLKEFASKSRDSSGKYIPQTAVEPSPPASTVIEDGAFVSPVR